MKKTTRRAAVAVALPIAAVGLLAGGVGEASASASGGGDYWHGYYRADYDDDYLSWITKLDCTVGDKNVIVGSVC